MVSALVMLLVTLGVAYILSEVFRKFGLPRMVGYLVAGLILGSGTLKAALFTETGMGVLSFLADLGIILLFYYAGLETNFTAFRKNLARSLLVSVLEAFPPFFPGFALVYFVLPPALFPRLLVGIAVSVSAQAVAVDILDELNLLNSRLGNLIISTGAVNDLFELALVTLLLSFFHLAVSGLTLGGLLVNLLLFILAIVLARLIVVPSILKFFDREHSSTARFTGSLLILLLIAALAEYLEIGSLIGALIAGIIIRQTIFGDRRIPNWEEHDIANSLHIIAFSFLLPLFFVFVGLTIEIGNILPNLPLIIALFLLATFGIIGGSFVAIWLSKGASLEGWVLGWGLNSKGDLELVIALLALNA